MPKNENALALDAKIKEYLSAEKEDVFRQEIEELLKSKQMDELYDRFYQNLEFGTGGLRGKIGGGLNRMNTFVVRQATQGLANYLLKTKAKDKKIKVVIAYDSRKFSSVFAQKAALVLAANGIQTYIFKELTPTPILSFMVRYLECDCGIVITASHNPPAYNGYKVFWEDGAQIVEPQDRLITEEILAVGTKIADSDLPEIISSELLQEVPSEAEEAYYTMAQTKLRFNSIPKTADDNFEVIYTPLHGTGLEPIKKLFKKIGVPLRVVEEQAKPDPNFTHAPVPNPENKEAFNLAFKVFMERPAAIILATDPDADRLGVAVPAQEEFRLLNGNEVGIIFLYHLLQTRLQEIPKGKTPYIIKTIVTSDIQRRLAESFNVHCFDTLTGFKNIGALIRKLEQTKPDYYFLFGNEESCGYLIENEVRDKDGITAAALAAEIALYWKLQGLTLLEVLRKIYEQYGLYHEAQLSQIYEGEKGSLVIKSIMEELRQNPQKVFPQRKIILLKDYANATSYECLHNRKINDLDFPLSNVLQFYFEDGTQITARPSGTEPKIKFYFSLHLDPPFNFSEAEQILHARAEAYQTCLREYLKGKGK